MPEISNLQVVVGYDDSAVASGAQRTSQTVSGLGSTIQSALGAAAVGAVVGLGAAFVGSVKTAMDFEKQLSAISAVSGATASQLDGIRSVALQLGKDTSFSASEAAAGMEEMVKAGVSLEDVMGGAGRAALDLAAAGGLSVAESATIASNAMNVFSLKGGDMAHVADVIAGAANASAIDVHDFGFSLSAVGAVAATVGLGLEDTATAIAVLGQAGLKGSDAGTSLKTMLLNLDPASKSARSEMKALGLITATGANQFFDATGKAKSMAEISGILQNALKGLTKEQQLSALQTMFGTDAIRAAAIMAKAGSEGFNEMAASMSHVTAQAVATERLNNLAGSLEMLKGSLETAAIILGSIFLPAIKGMVDGLTGGVNQAINIIEQLPDAWRTIQQAFAGDWSQSDTLTPFMNLVGKIGLAFRALVGVFRDESGVGIDAVRVLGDVFGEWAQTINDAVAQAGLAWRTFAPMVIDDLQQLGAAFNFATAFLADHLEIIAGVAAAWATFTIISTVVGWVSSAIAIWGALSGAIAASGGVITAIVAVLGGPVTLVILAVAAAVGLLTAAWIGNWGDIQGKTAMVVAWLQTNIPIMIDTIMEISTAVAEAAVAFATWASETATTVATWVTDTITAITTWVTETQAMFVAWGVAAQLAFDATWLAIETAVTLAWTTITAAFAAGILAIETTWQAGWDALLAIVTAAWNLITPENQAKIIELLALFQQLWTLAGQLWTVGTTALLTIVTGWWEAITKLWTTTTTAITTIVTGWWTAMTALWTTTTAAITTIVTGWWTALSTLWTTQTAAVTTTTTTWWTTLSTAWTAGTKAVTDIVTPWWETLKTLWTAALTAIGDAVGAKWAEIVTATTGLFTQLGEAWTSAKTTLGALATALGDAIMAALLAAINAKVKAVTDAITAAVKAALDAARGLIGNFSVPTGGGGGGGAQTLSYRPGGGGSVATGTGSGGQVNQFRLGLSPGDAEAACGPAALAWFMNQNGRTPTGAEALALAKNAGWDSGKGMYGVGAFSNALTNAGIPNTVKYAPSAAEIDALAQSGQPFALSTGEHYYQVSGGSVSGGLNVGGSGEALRTGSGVMTLQQILDRGSPVNGVIVPQLPPPPPPPQNPADMVRIPLGSGTGTGLPAISSETDKWGAIPLTMEEITKGAPIMGEAVKGAGAVVTTSFDGILISSTDMGNGTTMVIRQAGADITATITDATGNVTSQWTTMATGAVAQSAVMATGVTEQANLMTTGALTSVTALGTGILTTVQTSAGTTIATVTDMTGQVTSQYATLANGAQLSMDGLAAGVLVSTTDLGTGMLTIVQDAAGNYIATTTDLAGNVTGQYTQLGADVIAQTTVMTTEVGSEHDQLREDLEATTTDQNSTLLESYKEMGDGVLTITEDTSGALVATVTDMSGQVVETYDSMGSDVQGSTEDMSSAVTETYSSMSSDVSSSVEDMAQTVVSQFDDVASAAQDAVSPIEDFQSAADSIEPPDLSDFVSEFKKVEKAAKKAADAIDTVDGKGGKKSGGGKDDVFGKAAGGPVDFGQSYLIGEEGPEMFTPFANGTITPNSRLQGDGGGTAPMQTIRLQVAIGRDLAEEIFIMGRDVSIKRGTVSA